MVCAFSKSRRLAWVGCPLLGAAAAAGVWLFWGGASSLPVRLLSAGLCGCLAVSLVLYFARLVAMREYQQRLLLLYDQLDPEAFLQAMLPLRQARMRDPDRFLLLIHLANGYLYCGQPQQALSLLDELQLPEKALELRGLAAGNRATCWLAAGKPGQAQAAMEELRGIAALSGCKPEFSQKARRTLGYLELCLANARGRRVDLPALRKDLQTSRAPLHRLDVQYQLALALQRTGAQEEAHRLFETIIKEGGGTCYPRLARAAEDFSSPQR